MYNRYIPQPDGSFRRSRMQDQSRPQEQSRQAPCPPPKPQPPQEPAPCSNPKPCSPVRPAQPPRPPRKMPDSESCGVGSFLRQLLPKDFDTADLIVVLLLLLISADGCEDNSALLTLALYLFM